MESFYDAHCHLSTHVQAFPDVQTQVECNLMSTNLFDLDYVLELGRKHSWIIPCVGVHPWYSHLFCFGLCESSKHHYEAVLSGVDEDLLNNLPDPISLIEYLDKVDKYLEDNPKASVGEIGLDKVFKLPWGGYYGDYGLKKEPIVRDGKRLSNYRVQLNHQIKVMELFLQLSITHRRSVSLHCVKAHGSLYDIVTKRYKNTGIPILLHSYSGSIDHAKAWIQQFGDSVFFSISKIFNMTRVDYQNLIELIPVRNLLLETDYGVDFYDTSTHTADLKLVFESICSLKNLDQAEAARILLENWNRFKSCGSV